MWINALATDGAATAEAGGMSSLISLLPMILIFVVFYFILIVPQKKRDKKMREMLDALVVGDEIITIGGIYGRIVTIKDDTVTIETGADKTKIKMARSSIREVTKKDEE